MIPTLLKVFGFPFLLFTRQQSPVTAVATTQFIAATKFLFQ